MKRLLDFLISGVSIILLSPALILIGVIVKMDSKGPVFYRQTRVGRKGVDFTMLKFRTMTLRDERDMELTIGDRDPRVTRSGYYLRRYKLDELPQLINVFKGEMSLVGPRPEVRRYVDMYTPDQLSALGYRPGVTSPASIAYRHESELLAGQEDPEQFYIAEIMPRKLQIDIDYMDQRDIISDLCVIMKTLRPR